MAKRIKSNLYTYTKLVFDKNGWYYLEGENGTLFSNLKYPTKIKPEDLPASFVKGRFYKNHGFINAAGVKDLIYKPNHLFNHMYRDDSLYISYNNPIETIESEFLGRPCKDYKEYDYVIGGNYILDFIVAVKKYSDIDTSEIESELIKKAEWFIETFPNESHATPSQVEYVKKLFNK